MPPVEGVARDGRRAEGVSARVLLVEDSPVFRVPLRAALTAAGFEVLPAESAEAAEQMMEGEAVDVVLADVGLPGMDGLALARRHPRTAFLLMTGSAVAPGPLPPAVRAWLRKPLEMPQLLRLLWSTTKGEVRAGT